MDAHGAGQNALSILERIESEESTPAESIIGGEEMFFLPYKAAELRAIVSARLSALSSKTEWMNARSITVFGRTHSGEDQLTKRSKKHSRTIAIGSSKYLLSTTNYAQARSVSMPRFQKEASTISSRF